MCAVGYGELCRARCQALPAHHGLANPLPHWVLAVGLTRSVAMSRGPMDGSMRRMPFSNIQYTPSARGGVVRMSSRRIQSSRKQGQQRRRPRRGLQAEAEEEEDGTEEHRRQQQRRRVENGKRRQVG
uniref:Uncharacterized protein n=1 Tax=Vitrella brassicaformis TaxID=1169539 RepID=A0A7S1PE81_9ALVE